MKIFKSHFWYNKSQRNGIFLLVVIIVVLQLLIYQANSEEEIISFGAPEIAEFQSKIDSLKQVAIQERKPKIFPFNPNYISDYKGEQLGMSLAQIDRLHAFRAKGRFINSKEDFKKVTLVSDSLLKIISPYFKFPDWVVERNKRLSLTTKKQSKESNLLNEPLNLKPSSKDINKASIIDLTYANGVSEKLAARVINYRNKLGGYYFEDQLYEVFNISENQVKEILKLFQITTKPLIKKQNINTIEFKQLLKIPYIDYELCKNIFDYRDQVAELQNINELKKVKDFPVKNYDRIVLYLKAE